MHYFESGGQHATVDCSFNRDRRPYRDVCVISRNTTNRTRVFYLVVLSIDFRVQIQARTLPVAIL